MRCLSITAQITDAILFLFGTLATAQPAQIVSVSPPQNELNVPLVVTLSVTFDTDMDETTIDTLSFVVHSGLTGRIGGTVAYSDIDRTTTFTPPDTFHVGDIVTAILTASIESAGGTSLETSFVWSFTIAVDTPSPGRFALDSTYSDGAAGSGALSAADFDGDGLIDLVTNSSGDHASPDSTVSAFFNNGNWTYRLDTIYTVGAHPMRPVAVDLDNDGDVDIVTANSLSHNVSVLLNSGNGEFLGQVLFPTDSVPRTPCAFDCNGDGCLDIAAQTSEDQHHNNVSILGGRCDDSFDPYSTYIMYNGGVSVIAADLDNNGLTDLAGEAYTIGHVNVLDGDGHCSFDSAVLFPVSGYTDDMVAEDFDGDGDKDIAVSEVHNDSLAILVNSGEGSFDQQFPAVSVHGAGSSSGDLDGDGDLDIITAGSDIDFLIILWNSGNGRFDSSSNHPAFGGTYPIALDLDNDGDLDIASSNRQVLSIHINTCCHTRGDVDMINIAGEPINVADVTYLVAYLFQLGPVPPCLDQANTDGTIEAGGPTDVADLTYLVAYLFLGGDPPPPCP